MQKGFWEYIFALTRDTSTKLELKLDDVGRMI